MSLEMSGMTAVSTVEERENCATCLPGGESNVICDIDCTAPVFVVPQMLDAESEGGQRFSVVMPDDLDLAGVNLASDPFPPRTISLS